MTLGIEKVFTSGTFELDGGTWAVQNNIWIIGDDTDVLLVDAAAAIGRGPRGAYLTGRRDLTEAAPVFAECHIGFSQRN